MMSAGTDMNQKIISMNLDMMEEQRLHMHSVLDEYVGKVITAGRQWSIERNQSSFVKVLKIITKAMEFLSLKVDEMEHENFSCLQQETSNLIGKDELPQQQKHALMDSDVDNTGDFSVAQPMATLRESTEDDSDRNTHTCREGNLKSDQRAKYEDFHNHLQNILAIQDRLDEQMNIKFNDLKDEMTSLKLNVDHINTHLRAKVAEVSTDFSAKVDKINMDLSDKVDGIKTDLSDKVDEIKTHLSDKVDEIKTDLSDKVDEIDKELSAKVDKFNTKLLDKADRIRVDDLSDKIDVIKTELSDKIYEVNSALSGKVDDQINDVLETLSNREHESTAQINKMVDLENHVNTVENDLQNNVRQVEEQLDGVRTNYTMICELFVRRLAPLEKLRDILNERATSQSENVRQLQAVISELKDLSDVKTGARKSEAEVVGFNAETMFSTNEWGRTCVCPFPSSRLISGCQFDSTTGIFTAVVDGFYLVYISLSINQAGVATIYLMLRRKSQEHSVQICLAKAEIKEAPVSNIGIVELNVDDELFVMIDDDFSVYSLDCAIQFSCFRFG